MKNDPGEGREPRTGLLGSAAIASTRAFGCAAEVVVTALAIAAVAIAVRGAIVDRNDVASQGPPAFRLDVSKLVAGRIPESHSIDVVLQSNGSETIAGHEPDVRLSRSKAAEISGWAVDRAAKRASYGVYTQIGDAIFAARTGGRRDDVASALGDSSYEMAGFTLALEAGALPLGRRTLRLRGVSSDGRKSYPLDPPISVIVTP